ncbi:hypothetical protein Y032_0033g2744 [Ancylostoma ceylanicum]|uniref:Uncharacterized protein n=1 Tax=Ancylostoma ceylanicum TaxID=53326 RepID=A0A016UP20_9BILA|nr:hypothetical protein Y032_0033g2744 [Ancylostoma ceylanicum]
MAVDERQYRGAAFLGRDRGALHAGSGCLLQRGTRILCCSQELITRASMQSSCVSAQERRAAVLLRVYGRLEFTVDSGFTLSFVLLMTRPRLFAAISYLETEQGDVPSDHYNTLTGLPSLMTHSHHEDLATHSAACNTLPRSAAGSVQKHGRAAATRFITKK